MLHCQISIPASVRRWALLECGDRQSVHNVSVTYGNTYAQQWWRQWRPLQCCSICLSLVVALYLTSSINGSVAGCTHSKGSVSDDRYGALYLFVSFVVIPCLISSSNGWLLISQPEYGVLRLALMVHDHSTNCCNFYIFTNFDAPFPPRPLFAHHRLTSWRGDEGFGQHTTLPVARSRVDAYLWTIDILRENSRNCDNDIGLDP